jgi:hypothetical protein
MSYTPIGWQTGDTITAEKLNKMDNGWSVETATQTLCNDTITSVDDGGMYVSQLSVESITADSIVVTFDGSTYQCDKDGDGGYGDSVDFTFATYPFRIESDGFIVTETGGSHTVKVEAVTTTTEASSSFLDAVAFASPVMRIILKKTTWQQARDAMAAGRLAYYVATVDGDDVTQFVALKTMYNQDEERFEITSVGAPSDGLVQQDIIYSYNANDALIHD